MDSFFEAAIKSGDFVLLDFFADWCEPCKWVNPILDDVGKHFGNRLSVQKIDIDEHVDVSKKLHILSVPTLILFHSGKEVWRMRGFDTAQKLIGVIEARMI